MTHATEEIIELVEALPLEKQAEVADFARFLLARQSDAAWEKSLSSGQPRPRLEEFLRASAAEGDEPLDPSKL